LDINCIDKCSYQTDGKCTLNEASNITELTYSHECVCPYFKIKD